MKSGARLLAVLVLVALCCGAGAAWGKELIRTFHSRIEVHADASLTVTEKITVLAAGGNIKRGIYRDFPTRYTDRLGTSRRVGFAVLEVRRNGRPEPYHIKTIANGKRVYIGHQDQLIDKGEHSYELVYVTDRQLGFFEHFDELYWNVTGTDWIFPIAHAVAEVRLPGGAEALSTAAYTGRHGERGDDYVADLTEKGVVRFEATRTLGPGEGLSVAVSWPKGLVREPGAAKRVGWFLTGNGQALISLIGLVLLLAYYVLAWSRVGRDPAKGTVIPLFSPPQGFSPAAMRTLARMDFDHKAFAAAVVNAAVKGALKIQDTGSGFRLEKTGRGHKGLSSGEKAMLAGLFASGTRLDLNRKNHKTVRRAVTALQTTLRSELEKVYFQTNKGWLIPGVLLSLAMVTGVVLFSRDLGTALFMTVWLSIWTMGTVGLVWQALSRWKSAFAGQGLRLMDKGGALFMTLFALPFLAGEIFGLGMFVQAASPIAAVALLAVTGVNVLFWHLLKAPTLSGRSVMDRIEGFRLYLGVAEKERLSVLHPPEQTPELFERYLPFALALDLEHEWSEQFAEQLARSGQKLEGYSPSWYSGRSLGSLGSRGLAGSLGASLSGAVSASASAPGSSSGSTGGGSSGGGGGGGGGGGW